MSKTDAEIHNACVNRFIELANTMKDEGIKIPLVSHGMMTACATYATFAAAGGNEGGLTESGVDKMTEVYKRELQQVQVAKKNRAAANTPK